MGQRGAQHGGRDQNVAHVLYIVGMGRSGSTLLCRTLGSIEGFVAAGEAMRVLGRGVLNGDLCSCGTAVKNCELWSEVHRVLMRREPSLDLVALERTRKRATESWEGLRYLLLPDRRSAFGKDLQAYRQFLSAFYQSVRDVTGARVIVDASKNVMFARLLTETPGIRLSMLQLVRDSRGVAHSWRRRQQRPGTPGRQEYFWQLGPLLASLLWSTAQIAAEKTRRRTEDCGVVRYEDFVTDPVSTVRGLLAAMGTENGHAGLSHLHGKTVRLGIDHLIASNPNRSLRGDVLLREDVTWRREMNPTSRWMVTGVTWLLLRRYGYRVLSSPPVAVPAADRGV